MFGLDLAGQLFCCFYLTVQYLLHNNTISEFVILALICIYAPSLFILSLYLTPAPSFPPSLVHNYCYHRFLSQIFKNGLLILKWVTFSTPQILGTAVLNHKKAIGAGEIQKELS